MDPVGGTVLQRGGAAEGANELHCGARGQDPGGLPHQPKLATAGSGDVLTGILGTLLSDSSLTGVQGTALVSNQRLLELTACAAVIHGEVGRVAAEDSTVCATRLIEVLPRVMARFGF